MDDELDDLYGESMAVDRTTKGHPVQEDAMDTEGDDGTEKKSNEQEKGDNDDEEEDDEDDDDDDDDSDLEVVITTKPGQRAEPPANKPLPYSAIRITNPNTGAVGIQPTSNTSGAKAQVNIKIPEVDVDHVAELDGKSILELDLESLENKPWRQPGADITDYFNYGFDEFTWTAYCQKQTALREDYNPQKVMANMGMPGMDMMMGMGGMDPTMMGMMGMGMPGSFDPNQMGMFSGGPTTSQTFNGQVQNFGNSNNGQSQQSFNHNLRQSQSLTGSQQGVPSGPRDRSEKGNGTPNGPHGSDSPFNDQGYNNFSRDRSMEQKFPAGATPRGPSRGGFRGSSRGRGR